MPQMPHMTRTLRPGALRQDDRLGGCARSRAYTNVEVHSAVSRGRDRRTQRTQVAPPLRAASPAHDGVRRRLECDAAAFERGGEASVMLAGVGDPAPGQGRQQACAPAGGAPLVKRVCARFEAHVPPGVPHTFAEVHVLAVEEEPLVEAADLLERRPSHEQARTRDPLR